MSYFILVMSFNTMAWRRGLRLKLKMTGEVGVDRGGDAWMWTSCGGIATMGLRLQQLKEAA